MSGMSKALPLESIRAALDIEGIGRADWPEMTERIVVLHGIVVENTRED